MLAPPAELALLTVGRRPLLELRGSLLVGVPERVRCREELGESSLSHSAGLNVRTSTPGESALDPRSALRLGVAFLLGVALLLGTEGEGGGLGLFTTLRQIGMCLSAASAAKCLEQCGQVTAPGGGPEEEDAGTDSPRAARQTFWNSSWACLQVESLETIGFLVEACAASCFRLCACWLIKHAPLPLRCAAALKTLVLTCVDFPSTPFGRAFLSFPQICWCLSILSGPKKRPQ